MNIKAPPPPSTPLLNRLLLIGVGLIGGSWALDLKRQGLVGEVAGVDISQSNLARAIERRVIDSAYEDIHAALDADTDCILIATPVATLPHICHTLASLLRPDCIISDVGSTKQSTLAAYRQYLPHHLPHCIAAHPIAGSNRHGALAAQFGLFQGKKLILCPNEAQNPEALAKISALWQAVGADIHTMSASRHDAIFATVSHLPHLLAYGYMQQIAASEDCADYLAFAGSGFRDFTRIAASEPGMWADIALANQESLLALLSEQQEKLATLQQHLAAHDRAALYDFFSQASQARNNWKES